MQILSPVFQNNQNIPVKYTCDDKNISPSFNISHLPKNTKILCLMVDYPNAPISNWVHWLVWNINPDTKIIEENTVPQGAVQGTNDFKKLNY